MLATFVLENLNFSPPCINFIYVTGSNILKSSKLKVVSSLLLADLSWEIKFVFDRESPPRCHVIKP